MPDLRVVVEREAPEEQPEEEYEPLLEATMYLCYLLMLLSVVSVVVWEVAGLAGG
jgi:hypothetical protein